MDSASYSPIMPSQAISYVTDTSDKISVTKLEHKYPTFVPAKMVDILYTMKICESYIHSIKDNINRNVKLIDSTLTADGIPKLSAETVQRSMIRSFEQLTDMQSNLKKSFKYTNKDCSKKWTMRELKEFFNSIPEKDLDNKIDESFLKLLFSL